MFSDYLKKKIIIFFFNNSLFFFFTLSNNNYNWELDMKNLVFGSVIFPYSVVVELKISRLLLLLFDN